jgi:hypothetical protein
LFLGLFAAAWSAPALAAPTVSGVSGTFDDGSTVTVSGSNFSAGGPPISFLDFERGSIGSVINESGWTPTADGGSSNYPQYASKDGHNKCMVSNPHSADVKSGIYSDSIWGGFRIWYLTYDIWKTRAYWAGSKYFRIQGEANMPELFYNPDWNYGNEHNGARLGMSAVSGNSSEIQYFSQTENKWVRDEVIFDTGTQGNADAVLIILR